jgi:hypothetical protein
MSKVRVCIEDGVVTAVYSDDPAADVVIYDVDSDFGSEAEARVWRHLTENTADMPEVNFKFVSTFHDEEEQA